MRSPLSGEAATEVGNGTLGRVVETVSERKPIKVSEGRGLKRRRGETYLGCEGEQCVSEGSREEGRNNAVLTQR